MATDGTRTTCSFLIDDLLANNSPENQLQKPTPVRPSIGHLHWPIVVLPGSPSCWLHLPSFDTLGHHHYPFVGKRKGGQVRFSPEQSALLEAKFATHRYLNPDERRLFAESLGLTDRQVKTWFQNRRAKWRRRINNNRSQIEDKKIYHITAVPLCEECSKPDGKTQNE